MPKDTPHTRTCPACGRTLTTRVNRWGVEMWPHHMHATYSDGSMDWKANRDREPWREDNRVPCRNSNQPV